MQRSINRVLCALWLTVGLSWTASATIIHVPADQSTVQGAINTATDSDTILVAPGRYVENINFRAKQVVLASNYLLSGNTDDIWNTVLDGSAPAFGDTASVIIIAGGQDSTTAVIGFTITGGRGTKWRDVSDNKIYREGGGILTEASTPLIMNNIIINNRATEKGLGVTSAGGGGIRCGFVASGKMPYIIGNVFAYNQALYGGALVAFHCPIIIKNNIVWKNSGGQDFGGAGLWLWNNADLSFIENNTIIGNTTTNSGGGISFLGTNADVRNNIIRGNTGAPAQISINSGSVTVAHNNIQGPFGGIANVDQNPLFAPTNLHLQPGSPCVDSGDSGPDYYDREDPGNLGFALFPALGTLRNDKGAYGGLLGRTMPIFTSPNLTIAVDSFDFGSVQKDIYYEGYLHLDKTMYGTVTLDSVRFGHTPNTELYCVTGMPYVLPVAPAADSVQMLWNPLAYGVLVDTARIYHKDSSVVSPLLVIVTGKVACCTGTTGNVDMLGIIDLSDLSFLIAYLTAFPRPELPCTDEANLNATGIIDLADLSRLIAYLTLPPGSITLPACP